MTTPPSPPILRLLGGAVIESEGAPLGGPAAHRHRLALLALLAVTRRPVSRDKLVAYLWPERDTEPARNLLKTAVHELRKLLGGDVIRGTGDTLSIDPALLRCDVMEFEAALAAHEVEKAASLYAGPFLDGFFLKDAIEFEHWVDAERVRLERLRERATAQISDVVLIPPRPDTDPATTSAAPHASDVTHDQAPPRHRRGRLLSAATAIALVAITVAVVSARHNADTSTLKPVLLSERDPGSALEFDGVTAMASTPAGTVVTTQADNISVDMMVKYEGRRVDQYQAIYYNGYGGLTGWGLMVAAFTDGRPDGTITVLAGGITVTATPLVLKPGVWQHLNAERRDGRVTVTLDDKSFAVGPFPVNPLGAKYKSMERTSVAGDGLYDKPTGLFHGAIDRLRIRDLAGAYWIDRWFLDEGKGPLTVGARGNVLYVGKARWIPGPALPVREGFWARLESLCGRAFNGHIASAGTTSHDILPRDSTLVLHARTCTSNEIHIALHAGADRSRTLVLSRSAAGLRLTHEVHREDGTEDSSARYTGVTSDSGSLGVQDFGADSRGAVWRIEIVPNVSLTYSMRRGTEERQRIDFDLSRQVVSPPTPWGATP